MQAEKQWSADDALVEILRGRLEGLGPVTQAALAMRLGLMSEAITPALAGLQARGVADGDVDVAWVPGAFEIPIVVRRLVDSRAYDAVICLGAVIRGATGHYEHVAGQCAAGLQRVQLDTGVPVVFGVLTTENVEQAIERAGTKAGNKGFEAAATAIEMADLLRQLPKAR